MLALTNENEPFLLFLLLMIVLAGQWHGVWERIGLSDVFGVVRVTSALGSGRASRSLDVRSNHLLPWSLPTRNRGPSKYCRNAHRTRVSYSFPRSLFPVSSLVRFCPYRMTRPVLTEASKSPLSVEPLLSVRLLVQGSRKRKSDYNASLLELGSILGPATSLSAWLH